MPKSLFLLTLLIIPSLAQAQSGRAALNGWVAFEGVAYVDQQPTATVQLRHVSPDTSVAYSMKTDEHGGRGHRLPAPHDIVVLSRAGSQEAERPQRHPGKKSPLFIQCPHVHLAHLFET